MLPTSWTYDTSNEKLIDLGPFRVQDSRDSQEYTLGFACKEIKDACKSSDFVVDFDKANFDEDCRLSQKSSFEELQSASRDLEKRLHERVVKGAETKFKDHQQSRDGRKRQGTNARNNR